MPTWITGPLAVIVVSWCLSLANRPSKDGRNFMPVTAVRILYPIGLAVFLVLIPLGAKEFLSNYSGLKWNEIFSILVLPLLCIILLISWPPTITVQEDGLLCRSLLRKRKYPWGHIDMITQGVDGRVVIFFQTGKELEVNPYIQGKWQLVAAVRSSLNGETQGKTNDK